MNTVRKPHYAGTERFPISLHEMIYRADPGVSFLVEAKDLANSQYLMRSASSYASKNKLHIKTQQVLCVTSVTPTVSYAVRVTVLA